MTQPVLRFLSQVEANLGHKDVMRAFPDSVSSSPRNDWTVLFRSELDQDLTLVQSSIEPRWSDLFSRGYKTKKFEIPLFEVDAALRFRLALSPVKRTRGSAESLVTAQEWLDRRIDRFGAEFRCLHQRSHSVRDRSRGQQVFVPLAYVSGTLQVIDPERFRDAVANGVGRSKAYGAGLLSVARL